MVATVSANEKWQVETLRTTAREIHSLGVPDEPKRTLRVCIPEMSAIVIGSTQPDTDVNKDIAQALGIEVVRRRSGGGAVLVEESDIVWFDVLIPRDDILWNDDVGHAFMWLGNAISDVLSTAFGVANVNLHDGALIQTKWSRKVCFAGLGPGECTVNNKKVVGIAQRRTRAGAMFQVSINKRFDAEKLARLLDIPNDVVRLEIAESVGALPDLDADVFVEKLVERLALT